MRHHAAERQHAVCAEGEGHGGIHPPQRVEDVRDDAVGEGGVGVGVDVGAGPQLGEGEHVAPAVVQGVPFAFVAGGDEAGQTG